MRAWPAVATAALAASPVAAQEVTPPSALDRDGDIVVHGRALPQIGGAHSGSEGAVGYQDFADRPVARVGELAENVPGLIATQHSGTGKANQYFLRGFNIDHGTDLAGYVDGVPIMRSHGHGQGYLHLNFVIPGPVDRIDYAKGPYAAGADDFAAAGTVGFTAADALPRPIVEVTARSYGYVRALAAGSGAVGDGTLLLAIDGTRTNWVLDEELRKINAPARYSRGTDAVGWSVKLDAYRAGGNWAQESRPGRSARPWSPGT